MLYAIARLTEDGMIRLYPDEGQPGRYGCSNQVFHRGDKLSVEVPDFDSLKEAKTVLTADPEEFIMEFSDTKVCEALWFTQKQEEEGIVARLQKWHSCYGAYTTKRLKR